MSRQTCYCTVITSLLHLLFFPLLMFAQDTTTFSKTYDFNYGVESGLSVLPVEGGYLIAGSGGATELGGGRGLKLVRTDSLGGIIWTKLYGEHGKITSGGWYNGFIKLDGGYFLAGAVADSGNINGRGVLYRFDENGDTLWTRIYDTPKYEFFNCVRQTSDKGFIVIGNSYANALSPNYWLMKTDSLGIMKWDTVLGPGYASTIEITKDGGYIIGGAGGNNLTTSRIVKTDSLGNIQWEKTHFGGNPYGCYWAAGLASDGGYYIWGCWDTVINLGDFYLTPVLAKLDSAGNREWTNFYNSPNQLLTAVYQVKELDGYIYLGGERDDGNPVLSTGGWMVKMDLQGNTIWEKIHATPPTQDSTEKLGSNCVYDFDLVPGGGVIATGYGFTDIDPGPNYNGNQDIWLLKLDSLGNWYAPITTTGKEPHVPAWDAMVYPNPTAGRLTIELPQAGAYEFVLYNVLGEQVLKQALVHDKTILDLNFVPGMYLYQVTGQGKIKTGKVMVE